MSVDQSAPEAKYYTVVSGDTLSKISKAQYGDANKYMTIFEANRPMLQHPDKIYPGQVLRIPPCNAPMRARRAACRRVPAGRASRGPDDEPMPIGDPRTTTTSSTKRTTTTTTTTAAMMKTKDRARDLDPALARSVLLTGMRRKGADRIERRRFR